MSTGVTVTGGAERFVSTIGESRPTIGLDVHGRCSQTSEEGGRAGCRQEPTRSGTFAEVKVTAYAHRRAEAGAVGRYPYVGSRGLRPGCQTRRSLGRSGPCAAATSRTLSGLGCPERTDLDRLPDGGGGLRRPGERSIEVLGLDDVEAAEVFLRLREGAVGGQHLAAGHAHDRGSGGFVQGAAEDPGARRPQLLVEGLDLLPGLLHLFVGHRVADLAFDAVDRQQVLRHGGLPSRRAGTSRLSPRLRTGLRQIDTYPGKAPQRRMTSIDLQWLVIENDLPIGPTGPAPVLGPSDAGRRRRSGSFLP